MKLGLIIYLMFASQILCAEKPYPIDIRHINDDIIDASPNFENFEEFLSRLELDDDWDDLEEDYQERRKKLTLWEKVNLNSLSLGKRFKAHQEMLDLIFDQVVYLRLKTRHQFYNQYNLWLIEKLDTKPTLISKEVENNRLKALNIARSMARTYKKLESEYTLYMLIRMMTRTGNENFEFYYRNFKKSFPRSEFMNVVNHAVGEYYFTKKNYPKAEYHFKLAMADKSSKIRPYSVYKLAWTYQILSLVEKNKKNRETFRKKTDTAFRLTLKILEDWDSWNPVYPLRQEVTKDLAWFWALNKEPETKVKEYFEQTDHKDSIYEYYYFLAVNAAKSRDIKTSQKYFAMIYPHFKESRRLPDLILKEINLAFQAGNLNALLEAYNRFTGIFHKDHSWKDEWEDDHQFVSFNRDRLEYFLRSHAVQIHQNGHELKQNAANIKDRQKQQGALKQAYYILNGALELYSIYENQFPKSKFFEDLSFNHSNLLFELERYEEAMKLFSFLGARGSTKYSKDAAYNAVMAAYNIDSKVPQSKLPEPGKAKKPIPLTPTKKVLVEKIDAFVKHFPNTAESAQTMFTAGQIFFDHGNYQEAFRRFHILVLKAPKSAEGETALRSILSYYWENKNWKEVVKIASKYLVEPSVIAAGHEKFLRETLNYGNSQLALSKK